MQSPSLWPGHPEEHYVAEAVEDRPAVEGTEMPAPSPMGASPWQGWKSVRTGVMVGPQEGVWEGTWRLRRDHQRARSHSFGIVGPAVQN